MDVLARMSDMINFIALNARKVYGKFSRYEKRYLNSIIEQMDEHLNDRPDPKVKDLNEMYNFFTSSESQVRFMGHARIKNEFRVVLPATEEAYRLVELMDQENIFWEKTMDFTDLHSFRSVWDKYFGYGEFSKGKGGIHVMCTNKEYGYT